MTSKKITNLLVQSEIISAEEKELYEYGLHQGFILLANIFTTILLGWILNMTIESIIFLVAYIPLRSYAGGYHAKTPFRCYILSIVMISATLLVVRKPIWNLFSVISVSATTSTIIFLLAPVEDKNKPLQENERREFKKRINILLGVLLGLIILFWFVEQQQISIGIMLTLVMVAIMLLLGKWVVITR